eukprot:Lankesteria_metandrocarpae@DN2160_c0_g1_i1.p1
MDSLIGIKGKDFVVVAADTYSSFSVFRLKDDEDKIVEIDGNKLMGTAGPQGDRRQFEEFIRKNVHLHRLRTGIPLSTNAAANFTRNELANFIRSNPHQVNLLLGGYDSDGPSLHWMDYLGSSVAVDKGAHGYAAYFVGGILDRYCKENMTLDEAREVLKKCATELQRRFLISQTHFILKVVDKDGIRTENMCCDSLAVTA